MKKVILLISLISLFQIIAYAENKITNTIAPVKYFTNNDAQLANIEEKLLTHQKVGLVGVSGIGKTQLARKYATKHQQDYELVWFFDCDSSMADQFADLAANINKGICDKEKCFISENREQAKEAVMKFLTPRSKWLLVFDNIKIDKGTELQDIIAWENNGNIILSTHDSKNIPYTVQLPLLHEKDAKILAKKILTNDDEIAIKNIVSLFGGNPFFVVQAAAFLNQNSFLTPNDYYKTIMGSDNKLKTHLILVLENLKPKEQKLLYGIALLNNKKFSQKLLKQVSGADFIDEELVNISRFGLISLIKGEEKNQIFEMHDLLKENLMQIINHSTAKNIIEEIVDNMNKAIPKQRVNRQILVTEDATLLSNLELMLFNAEFYQINISKISELRKNMLSFYLWNGNDKADKMGQWFLSNKSKLYPSLFESQSAVSAEYLILIGMNECYLKSNCAGAIKYISEAAKIVGSLQKYEELKMLAYSQLAQVYVFNGNIDQAATYIDKSDELVSLVPKSNYDIFTLWFVKAKYHLANGHYDKSLAAVKEVIDMAKNSNLSESHLSSLYVLEAEILNYQGNFETAHKIVKKVYDEEIEKIKEGNYGGIVLKAITELSRSELGLGNKQQALEHVNYVISLYTNDPLRNSDLNSSTDTDLASAFVAQGDALSSFGEWEKACESYGTAEAIYYNGCGNNAFKMDELSYLYLQGALAACQLDDDFWRSKFYNQLLNKFGEQHFRSQILLNSKCLNK